MARSLDDFIVEVEVTVPAHTQSQLCETGDLVLAVKVDLTQPEFESAVLAAAGRFRSLMRTRRKGGRPRKYTVCKHGRRRWGGRVCEKCMKERRQREEERSASENPA